MSCSSGENVSFLRGQGGRTPADFMASVGEQQRRWPARTARPRVSLVYAVASVIACSLVAPRVAAYPVEIVSRARLDVAEERRGLVWSVSGTLRDDNGVGLPYRPIVVDLHGDGDDVPERTDLVHTSATGTFVAEHRLAAGAWRAEVRFLGDDFVDAAEADVRAVREGPRPPRTREAPRAVDARRDRFPLVAEALGPEEIGVLVSADCFDISAAEGAEHVAHVRSDAGLRCVLVAEAAIEAGFSAREERDVRRISGPSVTLTTTAEFETPSPFLPGTWRLQASARDAAGAVDGATIAWTQRREGGETVTLARARTDADGRANAAVAGGEVDDGALVATLHVDAPDDLALATSGPLPVARPDKLLQRAPLAFVVLVALALVAVFSMLRRPRREARSATPPLPAPAPPRAEVIVEAPGSEDAPARVEGVVVDAELDLPVAARITWEGGAIDADASGAFSVAAATEGARARFEAPGCHPLEATLPARGRVRVRLRPYRMDLLALWREVVRAHGPDGVDVERWWGRRLVSDVRARVAQRVKALRRAPDEDVVERRAYDAWLARAAEDPEPVDAVEALGRMVEHAYFDADVVDADTVARAQALADRARRAR